MAQKQTQINSAATAQPKQSIGQTRLVLENKTLKRKITSRRTVCRKKQHKQVQVQDIVVMFTIGSTLKATWDKEKNTMQRAD